MCSCRMDVYKASIACLDALKSIPIGELVCGGFLCSLVVCVVATEAWEDDRVENTVSDVMIAWFRQKR